MKVRVALTIGDPGGIGPEIAARVLAERKWRDDADLFVVGSAQALFHVDCSSHFKDHADVVSASSLSSLDRPAAFPVIINVGKGERVPIGEPSAAGGRIAALAVETAVTLARRGTVEGIVTGPISKEALHLAGYRYVGHTGMLSDLFDEPECHMMMVADALRVVILTRDMPLKEVPHAVTTSRIRRGIDITVKALHELFGIDRPSVAVAALNPHAGDGGVLGYEEKEIIVPAIAELRGDGIRVDGPFPADTLFYRWEEKGYDAFIALYHDQGMIPFKMYSFEKGVNMTIGLPVVRTSVCHGTAFDIAGKGVATTGSLERAIEVAVACCRQKRAVEGASDR